MQTHFQNKSLFLVIEHNLICWHVYYVYKIYYQYNAGEKLFSFPVKLPHPLYNDNENYVKLPTIHISDLKKAYM